MDLMWSRNQSVYMNSLSSRINRVLSCYAPDITFNNLEPLPPPQVSSDISAQLSECSFSLRRIFQLRRHYTHHDQISMAKQMTGETNSDRSGPGCEKPNPGLGMRREGRISLGALLWWVLGSLGVGGGGGSWRSHLGRHD